MNPRSKKDSFLVAGDCYTPKEGTCVKLISLEDDSRNRVVCFGIALIFLSNGNIKLAGIDAEFGITNTDESKLVKIGEC